MRFIITYPPGKIHLFPANFIICQQFRAAAGAGLNILLFAVSKKLTVYQLKIAEHLLYNSTKYKKIVPQLDETNS